MFQAKNVAAKAPLPEPTGGVSPVVVVGEFITTSASLALNAVIEMGGIPADTVPVDYIIAAEDCDSNGTPLVQIDAGILSGLYGKNDDARTIGQQFGATLNTLRNGGVHQNAVSAGLLLAPSNVDRGFGIKIVTAPATAVVGAKIRMFVTCLPKTADLS